MSRTCFKIRKPDFKNQILGAKISKMLIFHYISYKFDKNSFLSKNSNFEKNFDIWVKIRFW
jgi:hypothetical protein